MGKSAMTYTSNVIESQVPTLEANTQRMVGIANRPYQAYQGQRVANWDPMSQYAYQNAWGVGANANQGYDTAAGVTGQGIAASMNTPMWGTDAMSQYMNPYQQGVTDVAKNAAIQDKLRNDQLMNSSLVSKGAFGGSRHGLMAAEANRNLMSGLNSIQSQGLNTGYGMGQQQFNADRSARFQGIGSMYQGAQQYGGMYGAQQQADMARNDYMNQYGRQGQQYNQVLMDTGYNDWLRGQDYDKTQTTWLNEQLRNSGATKTENAPAPNVAAQLFGAAAAGLGAYRDSKTS